MEQTHGQPHRGLRIVGKSLAQYEQYARQYIAEELAGGAIEMPFDPNTGFTIGDFSGRPVNIAAPPDMPALCFVHKVSAVHRYEIKRKDGPPMPRVDTHVFYFNVTACLGARRKSDIEAAAGIKR